jgi:hypothetical protein
VQERRQRIENVYRRAVKLTQVDSEGWNLKFHPPGGAVIVFLCSVYKKMVQVGAVESVLVVVL